MSYDVINKIKTIVGTYGPKWFKYEDPLVSCIIGVVDPYSWILNDFPKEVWKFMSLCEGSNCNVSNSEKLKINIIKDLKKHL